MAVEIQYRTLSIEMMDENDLWYTGDRKPQYDSLEDALANSDVIEDWQLSGQTKTDLTVVRVRDLETGRVTYVSPAPTR